MQTRCAKCSAAMAAEWTFCPRCGDAIQHKAKTHAASPEGGKTSVTGGFGGMLFGLLIAPVMIIVGTMLCLTGVGAILGIPMIIAAVLTPLAAPILGLGAHKGKCPECGMVVTTMADGKNYDCPACSRTFAVEDHNEPKVITAG